MSSNSFTREFVINGVSFRHYYAEDSHGTKINSYWVNGSNVTYSKFMSEIQKSVGDSEQLISRACGLHKIRTPEWEKYNGSL